LYERLPKLRRRPLATSENVGFAECGAVCGADMGGYDVKYLLCYQINLFLACDVLLCSLFRGMFPHTLSSSWAGSKNPFTRWLCSKLAFLDLYLDWLGVKYPYPDKWPENASHCVKWAFLVEKNRAYVTTDGKELFYGNPTLYRN